MNLFTLVRAAEVAEEAAEGIPLGNFIQTLAMPVILVLVFYFLIIAPQRKRDKSTKEMLAALKVGDSAVTVGGIIGTISSIKDDTVTLEVGADKVKIKFERSAIKGIKS